MPKPMNRLDRAINAVAPNWGLQRIKARQAIRAYYDGAPGAADTFRRGLASISAEQQGRSGHVSAREQARYAEANYDLVAGALDVLVNNVIGTGITPEPTVRDTKGEPIIAVNDRLRMLHELWVRHAEVTGDMDYYSAQRLDARAWFRDGECFMQQLSGAVPLLQHGSVVPYSLEFIESDMVPADYDENGYTMGVKRNAWGRATEYAVHKHHPNDLYLRGRAEDYKTIPAERMGHLKMITRFRQVRGVSVLAAALERLADIKETDENERVAARVAAAMTGYVKKGNADAYNGGPDTARAPMHFEPGMVFDNLEQGEEIGTIQSNRPNNAMIPFRQDQMRSAAGALKVSFSSWAKNYTGTYSAQRQELVEAYINYGVLSGAYIHQRARPVYEGFAAACFATGLVRIPLGVTADPLTLHDADHVAPVQPWIDPKKEIEAYAALVENSLESRTHIVRQRGRNPDVVRTQIKKEQTEWPAANNSEQSNASESDNKKA